MHNHVKYDRLLETLFDVSLESFEKYMHVNFTTLFAVCREFARNNKSGGIVNFSATTGIVSARLDPYEGSHKHIGYCVSKGGVVNMTSYLAASGTQYKS